MGTTGTETMESQTGSKGGLLCVGENIGSDF